MVNFEKARDFTHQRIIFDNYGKFSNMLFVMVKSKPKSLLP